MGLFLNKRNHPQLYENDTPVSDSNQAVFQYDHWSRLIHEQKVANAELKRAFQDLQMLYHQREQSQVEQWDDLGLQLQELTEINFQRENFEKKALTILSALEGQQTHLAEREKEMRKELQQQIHLIDLSNKEIVSRLEGFENSNERISQVLEKQAESHLQFSGKMEQQEHQHQEIMDKLESQEALTEKLMREITNIRSVIFERATFLAGKIGDGYKLTSTYFQKIMQKPAHHDGISDEEESKKELPN